MTSMDLYDRLNRATLMVEEARTVPLSASCVVHRGDLLALLDEIRIALPDSLNQAQEILTERDQIIEQGRMASENLLQSARDEAATLISQEQVVIAAAEEAERILDRAREEADQSREEAETYIDARLATLEVILAKTMDAVSRGRARLAGEQEIHEFGAEDREIPTI
jgi:cell division septum initiation protein DivIVA